MAFADGSTVTYTYAADGTKLRTVHDINGTTTQTDYCGSEKNSLSLENIIRNILDYGTRNWYYIEFKDE